MRYIHSRQKTTEESERIYSLALQSFSDPVKTQVWFQTPNPLLGEVSPSAMIRFGRSDKLLRFVTQAIEGRGGHEPKT